ncbi:hypothetical protein BE04_08270 [Sorangium cellulosum]|uniref:DUF6748 domain-containing protein n=2 Tax=Sorangium cellulosum TaxID=56 RepID=A0A150P7J4_SORCE|nr:DUF6748 domain-containing protein [Sorangium cellulosum]AGP38123.1 hypothetical protein SCE1572_28815 [Sorangium cellulosum So0157-2]KYF51662.1 hypothetical protein BE04_08270 [Sorangium cellulosum]
MFKPTHHRFSQLALLGALAVPAFACDGPGEDGLEADLPPAELAADVGALAKGEVALADYFIVTHPDYRRCVAPICGGHFVARVNTSVARCADGTWQEECHMFELDLSGLGLDPSTEAKAKEAFGAGTALVRGELKQVELGGGGSSPADVLVASEIWVGATGNTPKGHFSRVDDSGIDCVTYPCPVFSERSLNTNLSGPLDTVDLSASGATPAQVTSGMSELYETGLLVAGQHGVVTGPAGSMNRLDAAEFYLRVK